jgi:DNA-binding response OmpR family regulator
MVLQERRTVVASDRRRSPRGGQRVGDRPGRHPRVIVADSYSGVRRPCVAYLMHFNFLVEEAADGSGLMDVIQAAGEPPAVVIMDCELADSAMQLKLLDTPRPVPVILLVDSAEDASIRTNAVLAPAAVLVKPFALASMLDAIRTVLRAQSAASIN